MIRTPPRTQDLQALLATPDAFRAWLETQEPSLCIGRRGYCRACPLARWLEALGYQDVFVLGAVSTRQAFAVMTAWISEFIRLVDVGEVFAPVTVTQALAALREATG